MTTFGEIMTVIHAKGIILNHMNKSGSSYICIGFLEKDYPRLLSDFEKEEVIRVNFHTSYGNWPEVFLSRDYRIPNKK